MVSRATHIVHWSYRQPIRTQPSLPMEGRQLKLSPVCTNCREKHLRCDGAPLCSRCRKNGAECIFVPSRRGMRPNRTPSTKALSSLLDEASLPAPSGNSTISSISSSPSPHRTPQINTTGSRRLSSARQVFDSSTGQGLPSTCTPPSDQLVELFYTRFLQAEQFIVPKQLLLQKQQDPAVYFLRSVVDYVGASYCTGLHSRAPDPTTLPQRLPNTAFTVQALLVLALWFEMVQHQAHYIRHIHQARDCGLAIGMNHIGFAAANSEGSRQLEESWVSTWQIVLRRCRPGSFTVDQQLQLPIEGQITTRRMTVPSSMAIEPQSWDWAETYEGQSAYQLMDPGQLSAQIHAQSLAVSYDTSHTIPGHGSLAFRDLPLTTTWEDLPISVTTAPGSNITSWEP